MRSLFGIWALWIGAVSATVEPIPLTVDPHLQPRPPGLRAPGDPLLDAVPRLVELPKAPVEESVRVSFDVGLPTGARVGARLFESRFWAEFGVGVWWIIPYASTALRYDLHLYEGSANTIAVRPSVSATIIPLREVAFGVGCDLEVIWQHRFTNRLVTDLGFRLGASVIHARSRSNLGDWWPVPIAALVFAIQF